jgi:hypothetical protein
MAWLSRSWASRASASETASTTSARGRSPRADLTGHRGFLAPQVAEVPASGQPGDEAVGVSGQFGPGLIAEDDLLIGNEQHHDMDAAFMSLERRGCHIHAV